MRAVAVATLAALVAALSSVTALGAVFEDAGFSTLLEPEYRPRPYVDIPTDTSAVSEKVQREAVLSCSETSPVFRACNCDILTWDNCGNIFGKEGQQADWVVSVTNAMTGEVSRLVSPVMFLREGVARFYFTPSTIGHYTVSVSRSPTSTLPSLMTGPDLSAVVIVHDVTATCSDRTLGVMLPQFQDLLWAHSQFLNEQRRAGPEMDQYAVATNINIDRYGVYNAALDGQLQQEVRRPAIQPYAPDLVIPRQPVEDNNMHMCDMIRRTQV